MNLLNLIYYIENKKKKIKYDFILAQILKEMNKHDLLIYLKTFKPKLEKKRMKEHIYILKKSTL